MRMQAVISITITITIIIIIIIIYLTLCRLGFTLPYMQSLEQIDLRWRY